MADIKMSRPVNFVERVMIRVRNKRIVLDIFE